jgi:hypothetical protein
MCLETTVYGRQAWLLFRLTDGKIMWRSRAVYTRDCLQGILLMTEKLMPQNMSRCLLRALFHNRVGSSIGMFLRTNCSYLECYPYLLILSVMFLNIKFSKTMSGACSMHAWERLGTLTIKCSGSSVSMVADLIGVRFPAQAKILSYNLYFQATAEAHLACYTTGTGGPFPGVQRGRHLTLTTHLH